MVVLAFNIKLIFVFLTNSLADKNLFLLFLIFKLFRTCENSPWCGVITIFVLFFNIIFLKLFFRASASKTIILSFSFIIFKIIFNFL